MYRALIYLFALVDIGIGLFIYYRACGRFGFQTYRQFLDREAQVVETAQSDRGAWGAGKFGRRRRSKRW